MNYTDGKNRRAQSRESLAALVNDKSRNPFGTLSETQFEDRLAAMTVDEKFRLCAQVGVRPQANGHVHIMDENLRQAFATYIETQPAFIEEKTKEISRKADYLNPPQSLQNLLK